MNLNFFFSSSLRSLSAFSNLVLVFVILHFRIGGPVKIKQVSFRSIQQSLTFVSKTHKRDPQQLNGGLSKKQRKTFPSNVMLFNTNNHPKQLLSHISYCINCKTIQC